MFVTSVAIVVDVVVVMVLMYMLLDVVDVDGYDDGVGVVCFLTYFDLIVDDVVDIYLLLLLLLLCRFWYSRDEDSAQGNHSH